jgi:hypothetical protein
LSCGAATLVFPHGILKLSAVQDMLPHLFFGMIDLPCFDRYRCRIIGANDNDAILIAQQYIAWLDQHAGAYDWAILDRGRESVLSGARRCALSKD